MSYNAKAHIFISGLVQGTSFRYEMEKLAEQYNVSGWIRNISGGRVEAVLEGEKDSVTKLIEWAERGPASAKVDNLEVEWEEYQGEFNEFKIKY